MRDMVQEIFGVMPFPTKCCGHCKSWTRKNPDDMTAPEGMCGLKKEPMFYPFGYWPHTLQRDRCREFKATSGSRTEGPAPTPLSE